MSKSYEEISNYNASSNGKTDANISNDSLHLGGIPAEQYATQKYVQDYHDTKETDLKEYIDNQDEAKLNEVKEYANTLVRNQDFSDFAKDTDINALDEKLSEKIDTGLQEQQNYTDTKTQAIVDDTNANFEDVNTAIEALNNNMNEVFQSVSDGKAEVAEAITDKGVTTSATDTFEQIATNIKKITTEGSIPEGYIDTSDASATASDILLGKSAYANGEKIYGTNTGIVDISQITPTYGTDTSGTTATASDILVGKTAYSNGQLLTGTLASEVEETYGLVEEDYSRTEVFGYTNIMLSDTEESIMKSTGVFGISPCGTFIVSEVIVTQGEVETRYIQSKKMNDEKIYASATASAEGDEIVYRKSLFSFEELGLDSSLEISSISIGNPGLNGLEQEAALCIVQDNKVHFYRYSLYVNSYGYIGYDYATDYNWHWEIELETGLKSALTCSNLNPNVFASFREVSGVPVVVLIEITGKYENLVDLREKAGSSLIVEGYTCKFSTNDNYLYATKAPNDDGYTGTNGTIIKINPTNYTFASSLIKIGSDTAVLPNEEQVVSGGALYPIIYDETAQTLSLGEALATDLYSTTYVAKYSGFSSDMKYFYRAHLRNKNANSDYLHIYKVSEDLISPWETIQSIVLPALVSDSFQMSNDMSFGTSGGIDTLVRFRKNIDTENIVAIKYKGKQFYSMGYIGGTEE